MRCNNLFASPTYALYRIFVRSAFGTSASPLRTSPWLRPSQQLRQQRLPVPLRPYSTTPTPDPEVIKDKDIESSYVILVDPDGQLRPAASLRRVLESLRYSDPKEHVVQIAPPTDNRAAICKIMTAQEVYLLKRAKVEAYKSQKRNAKLKGTAKEIELNWAIDRHDLAHQLNKMQDFLEQGFRVHVIMAGKRRGQQATLEQRQQLLDLVRERVKAVDGAKEYKPVEGKLGGMTTLYLEPKSIIKKFEMPWGARDRDLDEQCKRIQKALKDDVKVHVFVVTRKRDVQTTTEERQQLLDQLRERAKMVEGVREYKPTEGDLTNAVTLHFERKAD